MEKKIYTLLALLCSVCTFFAVGNVFYSDGSLKSAITALVCMFGVYILRLKPVNFPLFFTLRNKNVQNNHYNCK